MHLCAFTESQDSATLVPVAAVQDSILTPSGGDNFVVPGDLNEVYAAAALGTDLTRARLRAPSLDVKRVNAEVYPHERGDDIFTLTNPKIMLPFGPLLLDPGETFGIEAAEDGVGATRAYGLVWLKKPGPLAPVPQGDVRCVRFTGATTLTANAWTACTLTLDQDLPAGEYALVGAFINGVSAIAARIIIPGQNNRPGVPCIAAASDAAARFSNAQFLKPFSGYEMGRFTNRQIPQIEVLASAADTAQNGLLWVVKTA